MRRLTFVLPLAVLALPALAQTTAPAQTAAPAQTSQRDKMRACNDQAKTQKLKGDERKTFMTSCLSGTLAAAPGTAAPAAGPATRTTSPTTTAPKRAPASTTATRPATPFSLKGCPLDKRQRRVPDGCQPQVLEQVRGEGAHTHVPGSIQCQQGDERQRRPELDCERRGVLR